MKCFKVLRKIMRGKYILFCIGYMFLGYLRNQSWLKDSIDIIWGDFFMWDSFLIVVLPIFLILLSIYISWILHTPAFIKLKNKNQSIKFLMISNSLVALMMTLIYVAEILIGNLLLGIRGSIQLPYVIKYFIMMYMVLSVYGIIYVIMIVKKIKIQICILVLILFPVVDYAVYFYTNIKLFYMKFLLSTNLVELLGYMFLAVFIFIILAIILWMMIQRMELIETDEY